VAAALQAKRAIGRLDFDLGASMRSTCATSPTIQRMTPVQGGALIDSQRHRMQRLDFGRRQLPV